MTREIGSIWRKWDLHVHTPASFEWKGKKFHEMSADESDVACNKIINQMNAIDVVAFCIMDYWTFDGYLRIREFVRRHPEIKTKRIFPGIEIRLAAPTKYRLNSHVLISDEVTDDALRGFVAHMRLAGDQEKPPTREHLIKVGRDLDLGKLKKIHGLDVESRADEEKMLAIGLKTALVTHTSVDNALEMIGREKCLIIQPFDTSDGLEKLDWEQFPYDDTYYMKWADFFETRSQKNVDLFLGQAHSTRGSVRQAFIENLGGYAKPVVAGSDAHQIEKYGVYPSNRATWLKAQPTFKGLMQVRHEPALRCFIGEKPSKLYHIEENPTKYIQSISMRKIAGSSLTENWFDGQQITLNPGLIAVIGNKGSGKSALADILAVSGNSHCKRLEFLTDRRFRNGNKAKNFVATIVWGDGTSSELPLSNDSDPLQPERVRYLPQHFIEDLCNDLAAGSETAFGKELRKVIFSHLPEEQQMKAGTLDDLLELLIKPRKNAIQQFQQTLRNLNENIVRNETEMSGATIKSYTTSLSLKEQELQALEKSKPVETPRPADDSTDLNSKQAKREIEELEAKLFELSSNISTRKEERVTLISEQTELTRLLGHLANFVENHKRFVEDFRASFDEAGFDVDEVVIVQIHQTPLQARQSEIMTRLAQIKIELEGNPDEGEALAGIGLEAQEAYIRVQLKKSKDQLNAPEKAYQAYLAESQKWKARCDTIIGTPDKPDTIEYFKARIKRATEAVPQELDALREERRGILRKIHEQLLEMRACYEQLYAPVQKVVSEAAAAAGASDSLQLQFNAYVGAKKFQSDFLDFIRKNRKGTFYGDEESGKAVNDILNSYDMRITEDVVAFTDAIHEALVAYDRDGVKERVSIESQLRHGKTVRDLYDFLYSITYLEIQYTLSLGGKDISQLSPGEKGALLLVFYLLLDTAEIPIIIDQPEQNLDNESVVLLLVDCIRRARARRQVVIVTHNPNLAIFCDADQIIWCKLDKANGNRITYTAGAIEDYDINQASVTVLEGTYPAFDNRNKKYHKPEVRYGSSTESRV